MYTIRRSDKTTAIPNAQEERGSSVSSSSSSGTYIDFTAPSNEPIHLKAARVFLRSTQQQQQQQPTTRLTPSVIDALVKSLSRLIMKDPTNGGTAGTPKPMSLESVKRFLSQYHGIDSPADVDAVVKAFQQAYPDVRIAIGTLEALRQVQSFQNYARAADASNYNSSSGNSNTITPPAPSSLSSLQPQQQQQQPQLSPQDQAMVNTIVTDLLNYELASGGTYTTSELIQIIKQKYPDASSAVVMGVITNLAGQVVKVASITKNTWDNNPVTYWWNRNYPNKTTIV